MTSTTSSRPRRSRRLALTAVTATAAIVAAPLLVGAAPANASELAGWSFTPTALCNQATGSVQVSLLASNNAGYVGGAPADAEIGWIFWVRMNGGQWNAVTGDGASNVWETAAGRYGYTPGRTVTWGHGTYEVYVTYAINTPNGWQTSGDRAQHYETTAYQDNAFATGASCTA
jgi:hypothetical protein